jgi:hypothetical protein
MSQKLEVLSCHHSLCSCLLTVFVVNCHVLLEEGHYLVQLQVIGSLELMRCPGFTDFMFNNVGENVSDTVSVFIRHVDLHKVPAESTCELLSHLVIGISYE